MAKSPTSLGPLDPLTHGRAHISHTAQSHATTQPRPLQGLHTCQGWGVLLVVCMHRGGCAPEGIHLVPFVSLLCPHYVGVPLRCPPGSLLTASSFPGDHVVNIPSSQWLHNSCHTNFCAWILANILGSLWSCRPPCMDPAIFLWSLRSYLAPCMDAVGLPWLIWSCMDPGGLPPLPSCPDCHACTPPSPVVFLVMQTTMHGPRCSPLVPPVLQSTVHGPCWPSCGLSSPTTQPIWIPSVPGAPPASRVRPAVCNPGLCHPNRSHLKHP